jgi:eukaryotic-like serine/threonine-protein kinase
MAERLTKQLGRPISAENVRKTVQRAHTKFRRLIAAEQKKHGLESEIATQAKYQYGRCLIRQKKFAESEPIFRDCLKVFEKGKPSGWTAGAQKLLGESLSGQKKFAEAEPLLLSGYQGFKALDPTPQNKQIVVDILESLVRFYDDWGKKDKADEWRKVLADARIAVKQ